MSHPTEPFETQNVRDDDGSVIDAFFIETDSPPDMKELNEPILVKALREPAPMTRIFSGDWSIDPTWNPIQVLPADATRKSFILYVYSPTAVATDGVRIGDDLGMIRTAGKVLHNGTIDLSNHTGAIYVLPCGAAANGAASAVVNFQYWSVTE